MSGSWRNRVESRETLKPGDVADALRDLTAGLDRAMASFADLASDRDGLTARTEILEAQFASIDAAKSPSRSRGKASDE